MINIYDTLFKLDDNDLLSVDENGPLSPVNINNTIQNMVMGIANTLGYSNVSEFDYNNFTSLDCIYDNNKSLCIPIFNEKVNNDYGYDILGSNLTDSNVSFVILTPKSGKIKKPVIDGNSTENYCCTNESGDILDDEDIKKVNNTDTYGSGVMCDRLYNLKLFRYANQDNNYKFDCHPIDLDLITGLYYGYKKNDNNDIEEVELCIDGCCNFYFYQQIMEVKISPYPVIQIVPNNFNDYLVLKGNIKTLGNNSLFSDSFNINNFMFPRYCHIFNKIYTFN